MTPQHISQQPAKEASIIPARRDGVTGLPVATFLAIMTGLALRLLFVFQSQTTTDDSQTYLQLARDWVAHHVYGVWLNGQLIPTDLRMPGYPAFLAGIAMILGRSIRAISLSQIALDLFTCYLTAKLAVLLAPERSRRAVWMGALWLAATCPFVANYSAVVLTEGPVTFLATAALICFVRGLDPTPPKCSFSVRNRRLSPIGFAVLGALLTGFATLLRPEMPLLLIAPGLIYAFRWWGPLGSRKILLWGGAMGAAFLLPLLPWAARNLTTLHKLQIIAPRYATLPGEYAPVGYYTWTATWLERYRDIYLTVWKIGEEPEEIDDLPSTAFDSQEEKKHIAALFDQYNHSDNLDISPEMDREFDEIARERTKRHPLRTYVQVPFQRALTIWFTPRTEMLPVDGKLWPLREQWDDSHANVLITAGFAALGYLYVALAAGGIWVAWRVARVSTGESSSWAGPNLWGIALLVVSMVVRTAFLTTVEAPEPRYVLACYPAVLALAALVLVRGNAIE